MIIIVAGLPGSGKSYFASRLATILHAVYLSSDQVRKQQQTEPDYSASAKKAIYNILLAQMTECLRQKKDVVLDGTFYSSRIRQAFREAASGRAQLHMIEISTPESVIEQRLKHPRSDSDADYSVYLLLREMWEPILEDHLLLRSSSGNIDDMLEAAIDYLQIGKHDDRAN